MKVARLSVLRTGCLYPQEIFLVLISVKRLSRPQIMTNSNDTIGNRSHNLPVCSVVPQPLRHRVPSPHPPQFYVRYTTHLHKHQYQTTNAKAVPSKRHVTKTIKQEIYTWNGESHEERSICIHSFLNPSSCIVGKTYYNCNNNDKCLLHKKKAVGVCRP
jgi:hypothetical protein